MKVIVAGMSKTGTKTMAAALRELGYSVHDFMEQFEYNCDDWNRICDKGGTTEDFRRMYENVDAVTDVPACYFWDEIHKAFPDSKIILMTRSSEDIWYKSMVKQVDEDFSPVGQVFSKLSHTARKMAKYADTFGKVIFGSEGVRGWTVPYLNELTMKMTYRRHNANVIQNAPSDKLLVFDFKEGWKPLCDFLGVGMPEIPFPHENKDGSIVQHLMETQPTILKIQREIKISIGLIAVSLVIIFAVVIILILYA